MLHIEKPVYISLLSGFGRATDTFDVQLLSLFLLANAPVLVESLKIGVLVGLRLLSLIKWEEVRPRAHVNALNLVLRDLPEVGTGLGGGRLARVHRLVAKLHHVCRLDSDACLREL